MSLVDHFGPQVAAEMRDADRAVLRTGVPLRTERSVQTTRGVRQFATTRFPIVDTSGRRFIGGAAIDVTARIEHAAEIAKGARRRVGRHAVEIGVPGQHEPRDPLRR